MPFINIIFFIQSINWDQINQIMRENNLLLYVYKLEQTKVFKR